MSTKVTIKALEKRADDLFSQFVRRRDSNYAGRVRCCTCGHVGHWKEFDCGHYIQRKYLSVRYAEKNTGPQCRNCNRRKDGEQLRFCFYLERKYGKPAVEEIDRASHIVINDKREFLLEVIEKIKEKIKTLKY
jgi:hypothetical protein